MRNALFRDKDFEEWPKMLNLAQEILLRLHSGYLLVSSIRRNHFVENFCLLLFVSKNISLTAEIAKFSKFGGFFTLQNLFLEHLSKRKLCLEKDLGLRGISFSLFETKWCKMARKHEISRHCGLKLVLHVLNFG